MKIQNFIFVSAWLRICDVITIFIPYYEVLRSTLFQAEFSGQMSKYKGLKLGKYQTMSIYSAALCSTVDVS